MQQFLSGMIVMAFAASGLFFLKYWRLTNDRLLLYFAAAFSLLAFERTILANFTVTEYQPYVYLLRLCAMGLIILAVVDKNRGHA